MPTHLTEATSLSTEDNVMKPEDVIKALTDLETLFLTIYGEGRGEPVEGQIAIGNVIRNRFRKAPLNTTYKEICLAPLQFSCWNHSDANYPLLMEMAMILVHGESIKDIVLRQCVCIARGIKDDEILDNTHGALNYMTSQLFHSPKRPAWALNAKVVRPIGNHSFLVV